EIVFGKVHAEKVSRRRYRAATARKVEPETRQRREMCLQRVTLSPWRPSAPRCWQAQPLRKLTAAGPTITYFLAPLGRPLESISYPEGMAYEKTSPIKLWSPTDPAK